MVAVCIQRDNLIESGQLTAEGARFLNASASQCGLAEPYGGISNREPLAPSRPGLVVVEAGLGLCLAGGRRRSRYPCESRKCRVAPRGLIKRLAALEIAISKILLLGAVRCARIICPCFRLRKYKFCACYV